MSPTIRSVLLSVICGMMAAAFLHERGVINLSFGFSSGSIEEGALMALLGGLGGYAIFLVYRLIKGLANHVKND